MKRLLLVLVLLCAPSFATNTFTATAHGGNAAIGLNGTFLIPNAGTLNCPTNQVIHVGAFAAFTNAVFGISDTAGLAWGAPAVSADGSTNTSIYHWTAVCAGATADTITITCTGTCTGSTNADGIAMWFSTTTSSPSTDGTNSATSAGSLTLSATAANSGDLSVSFTGNKNAGVEATASGGWTNRAIGLEGNLYGFSNENSGSGSVSVTITGGSGQVTGSLVNQSFGGGGGGGAATITGHATATGNAVAK